MKPILPHLKTVFLFFAIVLSAASLSFSQNKSSASSKQASWKIKPFERKAFIENKGQFENILPAGKKNFNYCIDKGYQVFFYKDQLCYRFTKYTKVKETLLSRFESEEKREAREHAFKTETQFIDVKWLNANPNSIIAVEDNQTTNYSYAINNGTDKPYSVMCTGYSKLIYKNLYNGIDVEYIFHPDEGIEYTLLVHPGADIRQVKMQYSGSKKITLKENNIHITTILGDIIDHAPQSFYANDKEKISSSFNFDNTIVSFNISADSKNQEIVIDPWTVIPGYTPSKVFDNGVDANGNIYIYGGGGGTWVLEKYAPTGGAAIGSYPNLLTASAYSNSYYGDLLVESSGDFYLCQSIDNTNGAHVQKFSSTATPIWTSAASSSAMLEYWRMALNCITGKVIVAGGGINYNVNIAQIDAATGALSNVQALNAPNDISGLCVDETGKSYTHGAMGNIVSFNDASNTPIATASSGYSQSEAANPYVNSNGYNMMALGGTSFLFTSDGAAINKYDRNTHALLASAVIPGGQANLGSGILADKCNNLFVGASNGVYRFDFNLVQKEYHSTTGAVYDIAFSLNADIIASGDGFLTPLPFGRESCGSNSILISYTNPCNAAVNTVKVRPSLSDPPIVFTWDDGNTDSIRTNLSIGNHIVAVRSGTCNASINIDTVKIQGPANPLTLQKTNPACRLSADGNIVITLLLGQQIASAAWTPASITNSLLNDSTTKASGLPNGTYSCHLVSNLGCSYDTTITLAAIHFNPTASYHDTAVCKGVTMPFTDNSTAVGTGSISSWSWNFGDTNTSANQSPSHLYADTGTYAATLIVTDNNGCKDTTKKNVLVHPLPIVKYTAANVCKGVIVPFTDQSSINGSDILQIWSWTFGDNSPVNNTENPSHLYSAAGSYTSRLVVYSNFGCKDSASKIIVINPFPTASFTAPDTNGCSPLCVSFQNQSSAAGSGTIAAYLWNFGDGNTSTSASLDHCYTNSSVTAPKTFNVTLTVTSDSGCVSVKTKNNYVIINPNPIADFSVDPSTTKISNPVISFKNLSSGASVWNWNFGDQAASLSETPAPHTYADTGKYQITLIVSNQYSCFDTARKTITIEPDWAFFVPNAFTPNDDGINDTFQGYGYGLLEYEMFIFDRWGNQIFHTVDYDFPWNGKANGGKEKAQMDVYIYLINIKDVQKALHSYKGIVTLVR